MKRKLRSFTAIKKIKKVENLKIGTWNCSGLRAKIKNGSFQELLDKENPDILCLTETKLQ